MDGCYSRVAYCIALCGMVCGMTHCAVCDGCGTTTDGCDARPPPPETCDMRMRVLIQSDETCRAWGLERQQASQQVCLPPFPSSHFPALLHGPSQIHSASTMHSLIPEPRPLQTYRTQTSTLPKPCLETHPCTRFPESQNQHSARFFPSKPIHITQPL